MSGMHLSKEFFELLKAIGESKSKQEEDRIIQREIMTLKKKMENPNMSNNSLNSSGGGGGGMGGMASNVGGKLQSIKNVGGVGGGAVNVLNQSRKKAKEFLVRLLYVGE